MMKNIKKLIGSAATTFVALFAFAFTATADNWIDFAADSFASVDDSSKTITINSAEQLALLAKRLQNPSTIPPKAIDYLEGTQTHFRYYFGWTITLTADIDLAGKDWTPIGSASGSVPNFTGHFDGGNHTIRNLKATGTNNVGLFSCIGYDSNGDAATLIENLTIENANVCASGLNSGALVGQWGGGGRIKNVTVKNSTVKGQECVGGVLGYGYIDAIEGCKTIGTSTSPTIILGTGGDEKKIGGIAGFVRDEDTASPLALKDCFVQYVTLTGKIEVGGLLGRLMYKNATVQDNCVANVTLKTTDDETATPVDVSTASPFLGTFIGRDHSGNTITMSGNTTTPPTPVAVIGETPYATLAAAVAEAKAGDTITLVANTAEPQIDVTKTLTIDFGAYTLSRNGDVANGLITVKAEADDLVTLKGTTGGISAGDKFAIEMRGGGNLTIDGGVYKSDSSGALSLFSTSPRRTVTLNGGTLQSGKSAALHLSDANFVMNDGSVIGGSDYYVKAINLTRSDVKIKGGTITTTSKTGSAVFWIAEGTDNALTISGGVFSGSSALVKNNSSTTVTASITGGTFEGGISPYGEEDKCTVTITGGKFKNQPTAARFAVLPAGYSAVKNTATGYYEIQRVYAAKIGETKYDTIDEALDAANALAATQSVTVELLTDVTVATNVTVVANTGNTTAFTGDYTLTLGAEDEVTYECSPVLLSRKGEGNVTFGCDVFISDGNIALETSTGINFAATFSGSVSALDCDDEGENGFIAVGTFNGSANAMTGITGGTFNGTVEESKISGGTFNGTVTDSKISGGTFNGTVDLQEWCGISGGTFYCLPVNADGLVSGGTFKKIAIAALEPLLTDASAIKQTDAETLVVIPASTAKAAQVGETSYYSLYEAVTKVAQDGTIKLLADNSESFVAAPQEGVTKFTISGGSYTLSGTITTPEGYELKDNGDGTYSYGVKDMSVAKIGETGYATLAAAVAEAKAGDTITMLKTVAENLTVKAPNADFAIDLGTYGIGKVFVGFETGTDASEKLTLTGAACSMGAAAYVGQADSDDAKGVAGWEDRKYELNIVGSEKGDTAVTADQFYVRTTGTLNITNATVSYKYVNLYGAINLTDASFVGKGANFYILGRESKKAKDKAIVTLNNSTLDHSIYELRLGSMEGDTMGSGLVVLKNNSILKAQDIILAPNADGSFGTIAVVSTNSAIQVTKGLTIGAGDFITLVGSTVTLKSITNNGAINIDATGITAPVKVIDYTGTDAMTLDSYGTVNVTGGEAYVEDNDLWVKLPPVCRIGTKGYDTLQQALNEVGEGETIQLLAGTIEEGEITLPIALTNVTIRGAADFASVIKNTKIARRTDQMDYEGITIEGIDFLNSGFLFIGDHGVKSILSDFVIKNNKFHDYVTAVNEAPVHFNLNETSPIVNLTFTGNVIDGVSGSDASGLYAYASGNVTVTGNTINNVTFRPILIGIADTDGIADVTIVTGNTFSGSAKGRLQIYGSEDDDCKPIGTDNGSFIVNSNIFKGVTATQQICCWGINTAKVTTDITGNYYDAENPKMFWNDYNGVSSFYISDKQWSANLPHANSTYFNYYTELNEDGTIKESSKVEVKPVPAKIVETGATFETLKAAADAAVSGNTIKLLMDYEVGAKEVVEIKDGVALDAGSYTLTCANYGAIEVGGNAKISGSNFSADLLAGVVGTPITLTSDGLVAKGARMLSVVDGSTVTLTGNGFNLNYDDDGDYMMIADAVEDKNSWDENGNLNHVGITVNIKDVTDAIDGFRVYALYPNANSTFNITNTKYLQSEYFNIYGGVMNVENSDIYVDQNINVTGALNVNGGVATVSYVNVYSGLTGGGYNGGKFTATGTTIDGADWQMNFGGNGNRTNAKYYTKGDDPSAVVTLVNTTLKSSELNNTATIRMDASSKIVLLSSGENSFAGVYNGANGVIEVDMTGATEKSYTLVDAAAASSYGTAGTNYKFMDGLNNGYELKVVGNDLVAEKIPVCRIGTKGYDSLAAAMVDARAATTPEGKTITILGEVNGFNFNGDSTGITLVGAEGHKITSNFMADGPYTSTLKDATFKNLNFVECGILFSYSINDVRGLTIEGCTFTYTGSTASVHGIQYLKSATCLIDGLTITNNVITGFTGCGIILNGSAPSDNGKVVIVDNEISNVGSSAIQALSIDGLTIAGNTMSGSSAWTVNNLSGSKNITFLNNDVTKTLSANGRTLFGYIADVVTMGDTETTHSTVTLPDSTVLTKAVDIIQQDLTSKNASYAYNEGAVIYTDRTLFDEQTGKVIGGSIFGTVALINSKVAEAYQIPFLSGLTTAMVFYTDVANRQIELAGSNVGAITISSDFGVNLDGCAYDGTITAEEDSTLTVETDTTFAAGSKIYLPYEKDSDEFKAWVAANITAEQAENVTVYGCTFVAQIGDKKYTSLQKAVKAAQEGDTITMIADFTIDTAAGEGAVIVNKSVTIDFDGHTYTCEAVQKNGQEVAAIMVAAEAPVAVSIKNGTILTTQGAGGILASDNATVLIDAMTVTESGYNPDDHDSNYRYCAVTSTHGANVIINSGTYTADYHATNAKGKSYVTINGGSFKITKASDFTGGDAGNNNPQTISDDYGCTVINGGTFDVADGDADGFAMRYYWAGDLEPGRITGGTFNGKIIQLFAPEAKAAVEISGGTFNGTIWAYEGGHCGFYKLSGGTFIEDVSAKTLACQQNTEIAEGCVVFKTGDRWTVGVKIDPGSGEKTVPAVEQASDSTVNETAVDKVVTDEEVADKMKTETSVLGVKLTTESPSEGVASGMQAVVDLAKQDAEIKAALETASMVTVKVDVVVSPVKYTPPVAEATVGSVSFNLTPIATVTVISTNGTVTTTKSKNVDVSNTMIDTNQNIVVSLYTGFKPALLVHKDDNGKLIETFAEQDFLFADGTCTLTIHHFSTIEGEQNPSYVAMIGDTKYTSLQDAFDMVSDNTQTTVALLKDIELTETATLAANKAATLDLSGRTISWKSTVSEKSNGLVSSEGELDLVNGTLDAGDGNVFATCASDGIVNIVSGTYDGAFPDATGIATNAGPIFVSGGRFSSKIPAAFCAVGYLPNDTPSAVDGRYTVKDAETFIRNICAKQRYPWNGYVDITFEMRMNAVKDKPVRVFVAAYDSAGARIAGLEEVAWLKDDGSKPTVNVKDGSFKVAAPALTKIHLLWNSAIVFPDQKVEGITFKVFAK